MSIEETTINNFWRQINELSIETIIDSWKLIRANSELDRGMIRDEPITPISDGGWDYDQLEEVEMAVVDDLSVDRFEKELNCEMGVLHDDLKEEYRLIQATFTADFEEAYKKKKQETEEAIQKKVDELSQLELMRDELKLANNKYTNALNDALGDKFLWNWMWIAFDRLKHNSEFE